MADSRIKFFVGKLVEDVVCVHKVEVIVTGKCFPN